MNNKKDTTIDNEEKRVEFRKLVEQCVAFKEDVDFQEMQDIDYNKTDSKEYELKFKLKTSEDKLQQMLYEEYKKNRHSILFDQMQEMILKSRNGNLIGGLLLMKIKQQDIEDLNKIILIGDFSSFANIVLA